MQSSRHILLSLSFLMASLWGQYTPRSQYIQEPERFIGYVDSCAQFWTNTLDETHGGYYTNIDRMGNVISSWGTNKNLLTQTRNAYGFVRAYMLTGNDEYRSYAEEALEFMYEHAWDEVNGGWYSQLSSTGNVIGATNGRSAFDAHYALLGPAAALEGFGDSTDQDMLDMGSEHLESVYWDDREGFEGYYDWATYNGSAAYNKSFNATVDAITTHLLRGYLQTGDEFYLQRMHAIADQIIDHLVASMPQQAIGFVEEFDTNWNWDNGETMTIMGHVLKSAWCLARIQHIDPQDGYLEAAEALVDDVLLNGYDHQFGGPYKDYNRSSGEMLMWGNPDTAKAWWQMQQAVMAGLVMHPLMDDDRYLEMADRSLQFFMTHFVDHTYGDVYENRTRYGDQTWGLNKGGGGKAAYHSIETGYYGYLYSSAYIKEEPFTLYYWFEPTDSPREIFLNPLHSQLMPQMLAEVMLNDSAYTYYDSHARSLYIPANTGGEFRVTFTPADPVSIAQGELPQLAHLTSVYPNPFNASTQIRLDLAERQEVTIRILDVRGRLINTLHHGALPAGKHSFQWQTQGGETPLSTGVYLLTVESQDWTQTRKLLLLK